MATKYKLFFFWEHIQKQNPLANVFLALGSYKHWKITHKHNHYAIMYFIRNLAGDM